MSKLKILLIFLSLTLVFLFGLYITTSYDSLALNIKYNINKSFKNANTKKNISFQESPNELSISLLPNTHDCNNFKFKNIIEKDTLTLSLDNTENISEEIFDFSLNNDDDIFVTKLTLNETPVLLSRVNVNTINKDFFLNLKSILSYGKKNNCLNILYLNSSDSIPKNILKYISSIGGNIIITSGDNNSYMEIIDKTFVIYEDLLKDSSIIIQLNLVFFDSQYTSIGIKVVTEYMKSQKIAQKLEEINEKSINLPFFIRESYNFIDIFD